MRAGFTLIETLVTISLIGLAISVAAVNFTTTSRNERVTNAAERVRQVIAQAKANALSGVKDCRACGADVTQGYACGTGDSALQGWLVTFTQKTDPTPDEFTIEGVCSNTAYPGGTQTTFLSKNENLPDGVEMTYSGSLDSILFRVSGGGTYVLPVLGAGWSRQIIFTQGATSRSITVNSTGSVQ